MHKEMIFHSYLSKKGIMASNRSFSRLMELIMGVFSTILKAISRTDESGLSRVSGTVAMGWMVSNSHFMSNSGSGIDINKVSTCFLLFSDIINDIVGIPFCHGGLDEFSGGVDSFTYYFKHGFSPVVIYPA